ncbi:MAG: SOUL family heme-binding protein [Alphaproteobacteria bacterium]
MQKIILYVLLGITALVFIAFVIGEILVKRTKEPEFALLQDHESIQVRRYKPMIVAEIAVKGARKEAIKEGFRVLADYIFGHNLPNESLDMTAPVIQQKTEGKDTWSIRFVMPEKYTLETLPRPVDCRIKLFEIPSKQYVVILFAGFAIENNLAHHLKKLEAYVHKAKVKTQSEPLFAFYDPPWTLPFLRRNEIMLEVQ